MTAAEVVQHPEFKHVIWDLSPTKKGKVLVGKGNIQIAYEIHGHGPIHLVVRDQALLCVNTFRVLNICLCLHRI